MQNEQKCYFVSNKKKWIKREISFWNVIKIYTTRHWNPGAYLKLNTCVWITVSYSIFKNKC